MTRAMLILALLTALSCSRVDAKPSDQPKAGPATTTPAPALPKQLEETDRLRFYVAHLEAVQLDQALRQAIEGRNRIGMELASKYHFRLAGSDGPGDEVDLKTGAIRRRPPAEAKK